MEKSKEEILEALYSGRKFSFMPSEVMAAMDEYAKQEAIGFAEWLGRNNYMPSRSNMGKWFIPGTSLGSIGNEYLKDETELYSLYLKQKP